MGIRDIIRTYLYPLATMCSTIIGIGIFALPFIGAKVGLPVMLSYLIVVGALVTWVHIMFADLALHTPDYKRLAGFAKIYLGQWGKDVAILSNVIGFFGIMLAFMIIGGEFLYEFAGPLFGGPEAIYSLAYFFAGVTLVYFGISLVSRVGLWGLAMFFVIFATLGLKGSPYFDLNNLAVRTGTVNDLFLPYGAVLFALWASSSIPEIEEMLGRRNAKPALKPIIIASSLIAIVTYILFIILIVGICGANTAESAFIGLKDVLGESATNLFFLFGLVTSFTSFIIVGLSLKRILVYDMRMDKYVAQALIAIVPVLLFLAGFRKFIDIIWLVGGVLLGLDGTLILLMYKKMRPDKAQIANLLTVLFVVGMIYEIFYFFVNSNAG